MAVWAARPGILPPAKAPCRAALALVVGIACSLPCLVQAAPARSAPSMTAIKHVMARTVEARDHRTHFTPMSKPLTIKDGRGGGTLTAVIGVRTPTADAHGQLVFFWANHRFLGWDSRYESASIMSVKSPGPGAFVVTYAHYARNDPLCCPSLKPVRVQSGWSGTILISNGVPPRGPGTGVKVALLK
jgi:hypothetical protein